MTSPAEVPPLARNVDATRFPVHSFGHRAPAWWIALLFIFIESTVMMLVFASMFLVRENFDIWPTGPQPPLGWSTTGMVFAPLSAFAMALVVRHSRRLDLRTTRKWLTIASVLSALFLVARIAEIAALPWDWDADAHASCVWLAIGLHTLELAASAGENAGMTLVLYRGPLEEKHYTDIEANGMFWFFVVGIWIPFYAIIYFGGRS